MILPSTHLATLLIVILGMLCWGLWANTFRAAGTWRFELYYFGFALGAFATALLAALTLGTLGFDGFSLSDDVLHAGKTQDALALLAGVVFNLGNMLLVAAIAVAGMATAFPVAFAVAITLGVGLNFVMGGQGNAPVMFAGVTILVVAAGIVIYAHRSLKLAQVDELVMTGKRKSTKRTASIKGIVIALISGVILSLAGPLMQRSQTGEAGLGPYAEAFIFTAGILGSTLLLNLFFMNLPVDGEPLELRSIFASKLRQHLWAFAGGSLWCAGLLAELIGSRGEGEAAVNPGLLFGTAQGSTVLATLCGIFIWKEFQGADMRIRTLLFVVVALFVCGLGMVAIGPSWSRS